jgi:hypothetical protein
MKPIPFDIPFTRQFFSGYLIDHFLYKQYTLYNAFEAAEKRLPRHGVNPIGKIQRWLLKTLTFITPHSLRGLAEIDYDAYLKSLRLEIRATYFQAIETLFELIFSLEPRGNVIDNRHIWYFLSTSQWREHYKRIEQIASSDTAFLDREITAGEKLKVSFIQYLFYFGVTNPSMLEAVKASFGPIKKFLVAFAAEFSDRHEYNAFKHALRILPTFQKVEIGPHGSNKPILTLDMTNSITYMVEENESISFRTKPLDTERNMRMGLVCAYLISNIVRSRRAHFTKNLEGHLHTFSDESFSSAIERKVPWANFKFTMKPIYDEPSDSSK